MILDAISKLSNFGNKSTVSLSIHQQWNHGSNLNSIQGITMVADDKKSPRSGIYNKPKWAFW
ncbi:hypothetical protein DFA_12142 [Cavenderia fasciculata]|uniref:Uncharacterized protein n=1 Tax=Cavenderia fasciculata TaxID=261658 RepID=F4QC89_CACFS|nr:uncharacterized protein DFA_12142 [Cavenderia fasciculata]EGG14370.1 hypothetical protein DFA_12142 [Cavenderia fasciculata]|eukprot:XP_004351096.1 hypothetical protein DFA_12142 [Cavenderia fasciculata]